MAHRPRVYITRKLPEAAVAVLNDFCDVQIWAHEDVPVPRDVLRDVLPSVDGVLTLLTDKMDEALLRSAPNLKIITNMAVGYDNIDVAFAKSRGILVTNTPDVLTETTADLTFALLMATARRVVEAAEYLKSNQWTSWSPLLLAGQDVYGKTLGIVGMGRIGQAVARRAMGFGMTVVYHARNEKSLPPDVRARRVPLDHLLKTADFVCLLTPLTPATHHLIGDRELSLMKPTAILVNTARGPVVDEAALYRALSDGRIWGAGLDVFEQEPIRAYHPLVQLRNVVALPHIGSASVETRTRMAVMAAQNLVDGVMGRTPANLVWDSKPTL
ncbi:MAG: D-glycerate dehydrogenase [Alicyclobacillus sp.]|nr:D-glycerate dehydrogenase [Alicyclobacillus sp.]